ncbi:MAG: methyltransferase type 11 [Candidatus Taylorbacteria bacterium CG10_big_fil_rev_8_21_14_0_10_41_48]|uniref:Methyltransferase type 11 n=1 Tax=Candidatus Taylorbacteria bacterium CG10_big_fil_rev_8_21_14_0_10_41_48 TaxID=1975024 RepID=A0A2M8LB78_9BACT|nr:MAG: methyltransferase type 11 [Candidatus Taylorbacteria bacterium CG10_big_fil_rev_8_21_14_0_10_41_48]
MNKQVSMEHYDFKKYCYPDRWNSYYYQIQEILHTNPESVLEVGAGDETVKNYVVRAIGSDYKTLDIADDLKPDIKGSILAIPLDDKSFDTACAFEVLEHIPWDDVPKALSELARIAKGRVLISVPHFGPPIRFSLKLPFLPDIFFLWKIPFPKKHVWNSQHYWELGKRNYRVEAFRRLLRVHFKIDKEFIPWNNTYHHFFVLSK